MDQLECVLEVPNLIEDEKNETMPEYVFKVQDHIEKKEI